MKKTKEQRELGKKYKNSPPCICKACVLACRRPCWGTPADMRKVIKAGLGAKLMLDWWSRSGDYIYILCPANPGYEGRRAAEVSIFSSLSALASGCVFLKKRRCALHEKGLKPKEGRVEHHTRDLPNLHKDVAMSWDTPGGRKLVQEWCKVHCVSLHCDDDDGIEDDMFGTEG